MFKEGKRFVGEDIANFGNVGVDVHGLFIKVDFGTKGKLEGLTAEGEVVVEVAGKVFLEADAPVPVGSALGLGNVAHALVVLAVVDEDIGDVDDEGSAFEDAIHGADVAESDLVGAANAAVEVGTNEFIPHETHAGVVEEVGHFENGIFLKGGTLNWGIGVGFVVSKRVIVADDNGCPSENGSVV